MAFRDAGLVASEDDGSLLPKFRMPGGMRAKRCGEMLGHNHLEWKGLDRGLVEEARIIRFAWSLGFLTCY